MAASPFLASCPGIISFLIFHHPKSTEDWGRMSSLTAPSLGPSKSSMSSDYLNMSPTLPHHCLLMRKHAEHQWWGEPWQVQQKSCSYPNQRKSHLSLGCFFLQASSWGVEMVWPTLFDESDEETEEELDGNCNFYRDGGRRGSKHRQQKLKSGQWLKLR